jgi:diaminopimelate epimerase
VLRFAKYHGLGNDFVLVDRRQGGAALSPDEVRRLCDRHRGIGADGVLSVWPDAEAAARMQIQNADGSDSETCGNGLRCLARFLYDTGAIPAAQTQLTLRSGATLHPVRRVGPGRFAVGMSAARFTDPDLPPPTKSGLTRVAVGGRRLAVVSVSVGNPHAIIFVARGDPAALAARLGPGLARHRLYPRGVNVTFARAAAGGFVAAVYERGVGLTLACGSAASALGAAAVRLGRAQAGDPIRVELPGGELVVTVDATGQISQEGGAVPVFVGTVELP